MDLVLKANLERTTSKHNLYSFLESQYSLELTFADRAILLNRLSLGNHDDLASLMIDCIFALKEFGYCSKSLDKDYLEIMNSAKRLAKKYSS